MLCLYINSCHPDSDFAVFKLTRKYEWIKFCGKRRTFVTFQFLSRWKHNSHSIFEFSVFRDSPNWCFIKFIGTKCMHYLTGPRQFYFPRNDWPNFTPTSGLVGFSELNNFFDATNLALQCKSPLKLNFSSQYKLRFIPYLLFK